MWTRLDNKMAASELPLSNRKVETTPKNVIEEPKYICTIYYNSKLMNPFI